MEIEHSAYWKGKRKYRPDIEDYMICYAVQNSNILRDRTWPDLFNAIARLPFNGRNLKVVYRRKGKNKIEVVTSYWID